MRFLLHDRPPFPCEFEFILSCAYRLYRVHHRFKPVRSTAVAEQPSPSFLPFRDISKKNLLTGEFSTAHLCSVLSVSHTFDGFRLFLLCKLISSCSHVWDSPFRVFPRCLARPPRQWSMPSCRLTPLVSPKSCPSDSNFWSPAYRDLLQTAIRC